MKNIGYLECQKGGYHAGQFVNIICLESSCRNDMMCCCACIQEFHQNHKTKTLKKVLMEADSTLNNLKNINQNVVKKEQYKFNTDIMQNLVENYEKDAITKFSQIKKKFLSEIDSLENGIIDYYKSVHSQIKKPPTQVKDIKGSLSEQVQLVQESNTSQKLKKNVGILMNLLEAASRSNDQNSSNFEKPDQQSYLNFLKNSNIQVSDIIQKKFQDLYTKIIKDTTKMNNIINKTDNFWQNQLYKFSQTLHHPLIQILNPFLIRATVDSVYQVALMNPPLLFANQVECFRFRINVNDLQWVAVGVAYKNIVQKNNFEFKFDNLGHGGYLVSGNGGTWSHSDMDYNNCVKSFYFKQGDSITCAAYRDRICFIKDVPPQYDFSEEYSQREYFQLLIKPEDKDQLHPCVVCFYKNTEVEYLPSFSSQLKSIDMPVFKYKFSHKYKHSNSIILNDTHAYGCQPTEYKCCILDKAIEGNGPINEIKSITFRISRSTGTWIGLGFCHRNKLINNNYLFNFETVGHGCYLMSANGGSWSHIDQEANNIVRAFKFVEGDLVTCTVDEQKKKIYFKRSVDMYELNYASVPNDPLFPVVVLYYPDDQVEVLPEF